VTAQDGAAQDRAAQDGAAQDGTAQGGPDSGPGATPTGAVRVVLVDDQPLVRAGISIILSTEPDIIVVAEAADGELGLVATAAHRPHVVLMDVRMPGMNGIDATSRLRAQNGPPVLVLTTFDDDEVLWGALEAGAAGFLLKDTPADDLCEAIRTVARGGAWLDPRVTPRVLAAVRTRPSRLGSNASHLVERLSEREREVLVLVSRGASNLEIADELVVSERTVKGHVGSIFAKLGARDRAAAIILAYEAGLVTPGRTF
jgi:DNA-binding NarL/FixJ family response regulator